VQLEWNRRFLAQQATAGVRAICKILVFFLALRRANITGEAENKFTVAGPHPVSFFSMTWLFTHTQRKPTLSFTQMSSE